MSTKRNACVVLLLLGVGLGCGGKSVLESDDASGNAGSASTGGQGNGSGANGNSVGGGSVVSVGGSRPIGIAGSATAQGGVSTITIGGSSAIDAGAPSTDAGTSCEGTGVSCLNLPTDAACSSDADCQIAAIPSCGDTPLIGINQRGKLKCPAPPCVPPPPGAQFYYVLQDCTRLERSTQASVRCANHQCLTYYSCATCLK